MSWLGISRRLVISRLDISRRLVISWLGIAVACGNWRSLASWHLTEAFVAQRVIYIDNIHPPSWQLKPVKQKCQHHGHHTVYIVSKIYSLITGVTEDIRFLSDWNMDDALPDGKTNSKKERYFYTSSPIYSLSRTESQRITKISTENHLWTMRERAWTRLRIHECKVEEHVVIRRGEKRQKMEWPSMLSRKYVQTGVRFRAWVSFSCFPWFYSCFRECLYGIDGGAHLPQWQMVNKNYDRTDFWTYEGAQKHRSQKIPISKCRQCILNATWYTLPVNHIPGWTGTHRPIGV